MASAGHGELNFALVLIARGLAGLSALLGASVLVFGWGMDMPAFQRVAAGYPAMVPETAAALLIAGTGALAFSYRALTWVHLSVIALFGILCVYYFLPHLGAYLAPNMPTTDAMSPATVLCVLLAAMSLLLGTSENRGRVVSLISTAVSVALGFTVLETYVIASEDLGHTFGVSTMAIHTALGFLLLNVALFIENSDSSFTRWIFSRRPQARLLRRAAAFVLVVQAAVFVALLQASHAGLITPGFRFALMQSVMLLVAAIGFFTLGRFVDEQEAEDRLGATLNEAYATVQHRKDLSAEQEENLRILGQIVAGVAHDFNNTLASMQGNLELIELDPENRDTYTKEAIAAVARAADLTGQLLATGRKARGDRPSEDPSGVVNQVTTLFERVLPANIEITSTVEDADYRGMTLDGATLERCLLNLLVNSRDALPEGGKIKVAMSAQQVDNGFAASFNYKSGLTPGRYVLIEVSDTGTGMPPDVVRKATQPYFSTKGLAKGSGLGLASVNGVCQQNGGGLLISSEQGKGTKIILALPMEHVPGETGLLSDHQDAGANDAPVARAPERPAAPCDILILSSHQKTQQRLEAAVRRRGLQTNSISSLEGLEARLNDAALPSVVLIGDDIIEGQRGADLADTIEARFPDVAAACVGETHALKDIASPEHV